MLAAHDLSIGHRGRTVAAGITLALRPGEVTVLLGPNGGGKTTLLRTLLGLAPPLRGRVLLDGRPLARLSRREIGRRLAYVPQSQPGGTALRARDVVAMGRAARLPVFAAPGRAELAAADAALDRLGILPLAARPLAALSGGERQLVLLARALVQQPGCILMDEPTASLDFGNQAMVLGWVRSLAEDGIAVLLTTHHPDHAFLVADQVALLPRGGPLAGPGAPDAVVTPGALRAMYGVEVALADLPTPAGPRRICVPLLPRPGPPPPGSTPRAPSGM